MSCNCNQCEVHVKKVICQWCDGNTITLSNDLYKRYLENQKVLCSKCLVKPPVIHTKYSNGKIKISYPCKDKKITDNRKKLHVRLVVYAYKDCPNCKGRGINTGIFNITEAQCRRCYLRDYGKELTSEDVFEYV